MTSKLENKTGNKRKIKPARRTKIPARSNLLGNKTKISWEIRPETTKTQNRGGGHNLLDLD